MKSILKSATSIAALGMTLCSGLLDAAWYEDMKFKGDLRYRFEKIEDKKAAGTVDQTRHRLRLRFGAYGKVGDQFDYGVGLATGSTTDPVSTNQTLGGDSASKTINLNLAYVTLHTTDTLDLTFGKMNNPFYAAAKNQLLYDSDLTPEGIALKYKTGDFYANAAYFFFESDRKTTGATVNTENEGMAGLQIGYKKDNFNAAIAYYDFELGLDNEYVAPATIFHDYNIIDLTTEYTATLGSTKLTFYGDYLKNIGTENYGAEDQDQGYAFGINAKFGSKWKAGIEYKDLETNAIPKWKDLGAPAPTDSFAIADSDFGDGKTDVKGVKLSAGYAFMKNTEAALTYFINEYNASTTGTDYNRLQADLIFKF